MDIGEKHPGEGPRAPVEPGRWASAGYPPGAHPAGDGSWTFALYSGRAERVLLELFDAPVGGDASSDYWLARGADGVWRARVAGLAPGTYYGFRCWGPNFAWDAAWARGNSAAGFRCDCDAAGNRFNPNKLLIDPYARELSHDRETPALAAAGHGGAMYLTGPQPYAGVASRTFDTGPWAPKSVTVEAPDAPEDRPRFRQKDTVVYEVHPRGFTRHPSSGELTAILAGVQGFEEVQDVPEAERGTYAGAARMAPYLAALGVNTVELLPVHECANDLNTSDDVDAARTAPPRGNYWGYMTYGFFAPDRRYARDQRPGGPTREFREMVRAFHARGIKVYLDVVYNHYAEMGVAREPVAGGWVEHPERAEILGLRGIDNAGYYVLAGDANQFYWDSTGCGNDLAASQAPVRALILDSLAYWAEHLGVDGFRFDLAAVLGRTAKDHGFETTSALLRGIEALAERLRFDVVAEPWDLDGAYIGGFPCGWAEWNGGYRDGVRDFLRGQGDLTSFTDAVNGSYARFHGAGGPQKSINLLTAHDGFTLMDLVSYDAPCNGAPWPFGPSDGGASDNRSWDSGGDHAFRRQRLRNFLAVQFFSRGVPFLLGGDELGRTQNGNNNPYQLDNAALWLNYAMIRGHAPTRTPVLPGARAAYHDNHGVDLAPGPTSGLFAFVRHLATTRAAHRCLRQARYGDLDVDQGGDVTYRFERADGGRELQGWERCVRLHIDGSPVGGADFLVLVDMYTEAVDFALPAPAAGRCWRRIADTAAWAEPEGNAWPVTAAARIDGAYRVNPWSIVVLQEAPV